MRFIVVLLALIGSLASLALGLLFLGVLYYQQDVRNAMVGAEVDPETLLFDPADPLLFKTAVFLLAASALGLLGMLLTVARRGAQGAVLLLLAALGPLLFSPGTIAYTGALVLAALFSLLVKPPLVEVPAAE